MFRIRAVGPRRPSPLLQALCFLNILFLLRIIHIYRERYRCVCICMYVCMYIYIYIC